MVNQSNEVSPENCTHRQPGVRCSALPLVGGKLAFCDPRQCGDLLQEETIVEVPGKPEQTATGD